MPQRRIQHIYPCDEETFWQELFLSDEHNRACYLDTLGFERWQVISSEERGGRLHRVIEAVPPTADLPGPLKKLLANGNGYRESGVYDPSTRRYEIEVTPFSMAGRLSIGGTLTTQTHAEGCERTYVADVSAKVFGVGSLLERTILDSTEKAYAKAAQFAQTWIRERKLA